MAEEVYTVRVHHEPGEELWAEVLELPGCFAAGANTVELREALSEAISLYLSEPGT
jgi:predicted RNase H-like HicB family nuclease